ncbi:MAG: protein kinase interacting protein [Reichenbachiella sp.]
MKKIPALLFFLFLASCSEEENQQVRAWEILALEKQVTDLNGQNEELSLILKKMNSNHASIRHFTNNLVGEVEIVKRKIIDFANSPEPEMRVSKQIISTKGRFYPRTFTFKQKQIPKKLTRFVVKSLSSFDKHPRVNGNVLDTFLNEIDHENPNAIIEEELFDGLNIGQTIQLLELVQIRILMEENKYLTKQFDHAINRMVVFPLKNNAQ